MTKAQPVSIVQSQLTILTSMEKKCLDLRRQARKLNKPEQEKAFELLAQWCEDEYQALTK